MAHWWYCYFTGVLLSSSTTGFTEHCTTIISMLATTPITILPLSPNPTPVSHFIQSLFKSNRQDWILIIEIKNLTQTQAQWLNYITLACKYFVWQRLSTQWQKYFRIMGSFWYRHWYRYILEKLTSSECLLTLLLLISWTTWGTATSSSSPNGPSPSSLLSSILFTLLRKCLLYSLFSSLV